LDGLFIFFFLYRYENGFWLIIGGGGQAGSALDREVAQLGHEGRHKPWVCQELAAAISKRPPLSKKYLMQEMSVETTSLCAPHASFMPKTGFDY